jgi:hypothetical protein
LAGYSATRIYCVNKKAVVNIQALSLALYSEWPLYDSISSSSFTMIENVDECMAKEIFDELITKEIISETELLIIKDVDTISLDKFWELRNDLKSLIH